MTASPVLMAPSSSMMLNHHRDEQQIRAQFLLSLGIVRTSPAAPMMMMPARAEAATVSRQPELEQCHTSRSSSKPDSSNSIEVALKYIAEDIIVSDDESSLEEDVHRPLVSFCETVAVREIPSHRDYDADTKQNVWNGAHALSALVQRNKIEYTAENWDWEQVLEEDAFVQLASGELIHPATYKHQQELQAQERLRRKQLKQKKQQSCGYKSISQCLNFTAPPKARSHSSRSRRRKSSSIRKQHAQKVLVSMAAAAAQ